MNDNAKKWVEALRSGAYQQTTDYLCRDGKYCCLGVACELYQSSVGGLTVERLQLTDEMESEDEFDEYGEPKIVSVPYEVIEYGKNSETLPDEVREWLGLGDEQGKYGTGHFKDSLASRNDAGKTFAEIADIIESEPEGLFVTEP